MGTLYYINWSTLILKTVLKRLLKKAIQEYDEIFVVYISNSGFVSEYLKNSQKIIRKRIITQ